MDIKSDQSGVLLLLALVMTGVILSAAFIVSTIVIREIRVSQIADREQLAYFVSENRAEEAAYNIVRNNAELASLDGTSGTVRDTNWFRTAKNTTNEFVFDYIPEGATETVDLYNRENADDGAGLNSVSFEFSNQTQLDIEVFEWDGASLESYSTASFACAGFGCFNNISLNPARAYQIILNAPNREVADLIVTTNPSSSLVQTSIVINVRSENKGTTQEVRITLPVEPPWGAVPLVTDCANLVKDGNESDIDCGGSCNSCADGLVCRVNADCVSGECSEGICQPAANTDPTIQIIKPQHEQAFTITSDYAVDINFEVEITDPDNDNWIVTMEWEEVGVRLVQFYDEITTDKIRVRTSEVFTEPELLPFLLAQFKLRVTVDDGQGGTIGTDEIDFYLIP